MISSKDTIITMRFHADNPEHQEALQRLNTLVARGKQADLSYNKRDGFIAAINQHAKLNPTLYEAPTESPFAKELREFQRTILDGVRELLAGIRRGEAYIIPDEHELTNDENVNEFLAGILARQDN